MRGEAKPALAVVGATGAVGTVMLEILSRRQDVWGNIVLLASERSAGRCLALQGGRARRARAHRVGVRRRRRGDVRRTRRGLSTVGTGRCRQRRRCRRQLGRIPDGRRRAAGRSRGQCATDPQPPQGHRRQPQLHDDGDDGSRWAPCTRDGGCGSLSSRRTRRHPVRDRPASTGCTTSSRWLPATEPSASRPATSAG